MVWFIILAVLALIFFILMVINIFDGGDFGILFILGLICGLGSFYSYKNYQEGQFDRMAVSEACVDGNARAVPAPATVGTVRDDRIGLIYPCFYLLDQGIHAGVEGQVEAKPMPLRGGVSEQLFADAHFTAEGSLNGWLLLGSGSVDGNFSAEQSVERTQVVAFMAGTNYGFANFIVETGSVRYQMCENACEPSVSIWTSAEPLFDKRDDENRDRSIWYPSDSQPQIGPLTQAGTPASPGRTVQALATRIVVTLPAELMPGTAA